MAMGFWRFWLAVSKSYVFGLLFSLNICLFIDPYVYEWNIDRVLFYMFNLLLQYDKLSPVYLSIGYENQSWL